MGGAEGRQASAVLAALADLAPSAEQRSTGLVVPTEWFRWLPINSLRLFFPEPFPGSSDYGGQNFTPLVTSPAARAVLIDRQLGERLAAIDQIRTERSLRVGWLFVAGRTKSEYGKSRRVFHPLVTLPVRVERPPAIGRARLVPAGDVEVSDQVTDGDVRRQLESHIEYGGGALIGSEVEVAPALLARLDRLRRFAHSLADAAGLPASTLVPATSSPDVLLRADRLVIVAGVGVYALRDAGESSRASSLRAWASGPLDQPTAFHSLYLGPQPPERQVDRVVESPYLLTPVQRQAIVSSRSEPVTLISGAPGTGKSHTIAAIAGDALARGERVLVAAKSDATVDALLDLLERAPGPDPVVFGSNERREALAERLSAGLLHPVFHDAVTSALRDSEVHARRRDELHRRIAERLGAEVILDDADPATTSGGTVAPGLLAPDVDLDQIEPLVRVARSAGSGWWSQRRRRRALRRLASVAQSQPDATFEEIATAVTVARGRRAAVVLQATGGLELGGLWTDLRAADDEARMSRGQWLAAVSRSEDRLTYSTLAAVAALATALRSGRSARRAQLGRINDDKLTRALPLWVGTLADVDDLLPPVAGLFDLVILDEASSVDQALAATALLRGRRAVIAGDPRQLRQVSFVSDAQVREVVAANGLADQPTLAARLDVRRNSVFDLAAGATPVLVLDEHFRSDPHLVDFVARRLYDGKLQVATRSPRTQSKDCVDVVRLDGRRDTDGVVAAEVEQAVSELRALQREGMTSVGIVTPFRAQADALEKAVLDAFSADDLEALDLRVGTAHAFQGNERDLVIVSLGVGPDDSAASWRFIEDPHLFSVLMTRARRRLTILVSADPPEGGMVAGYLAQADRPPGPPRPVCRVGDWARGIAEELAAAGVPIVTAYPTGRHVVDVCGGDERASIDIECAVHPDGPEAHIDRHLALARSGWEFIEAYQSRWGDRRAELIVELLGRLQSTRP